MSDVCFSHALARPHSPGAFAESCSKSPKLSGFCAESWARFFHRVHPVKTAAAVAAEIGVSASTVENWLDGTSAPSLPAFVKAVQHYGPGCLAAAFARPPAWVDATARAQKRAAIEAEISRLVSELKEHS